MTSEATSRTGAPDLGGFEFQLRLLPDTNLSTRSSILKSTLDFRKKKFGILCDFRSETAKKLSETAKQAAKK